MKHLDLSVLLKSLSNWYSNNIIKPRPVEGFFICGGGVKYYLTMKIIMDMKDV